MSPNTLSERRGISTTTSTTTTTTPSSSSSTAFKANCVMTMGQFREACEHESNKDKCLIVIMGKIYDVSDWASSHPGGPLVIQNLNGKDATDHFYTSHPFNVGQSHLSRFLIGEISDFKQTPLQKDFYAIRDQMQKEGLFKPRTMWYFQHMSFLGFIFCVSIYLALNATQFYTYMISAFLMGVFWQQLSFMGHDFGHNSVFENKRYNVIGGIIATSLFGVSGAWWRRVHNVHHVVPNSQEGDPDIQYLPLFAVGEKSCRDYYSIFHKRVFKFDQAAKFLISYQHIFYVPVLLIARFNLQAQGALLLWNHQIPVPNRTYEKISQLVFASWLIALLSAMPDWTTLISYLLVSYSVCGIIHIQIILSHFGMDIYDGLGHNDESTDFIHTQLAATMDIDCDPWMDWFHGGLQFQIEHHLFPRTPRPNLRIIMAKYIKPLCEKHKITYQSLNFLDINIKVFETMKSAALYAQKSRKSSPFSESLIGKILNADG